MDRHTGAEAVRFARSVVMAEVSFEPIPPPLTQGEFSMNRGAFVTLSTYPSGELRGCIGYPYPTMPLGRVLVESARSACHDPRFPDLEGDEARAVTVEVTILSPPVSIGSGESLPGRIVVGRDGLMIECMGRRGLLLPQVPLEWGWDAMGYLDALCALPMLLARMRIGKMGHGILLILSAVMLVLWTFGYTIAVQVL